MWPPAAVSASSAEACAAHCCAHPHAHRFQNIAAPDDPSYLLYVLQSLLGPLQGLGNAVTRSAARDTSRSLSHRSPAPPACASFHMVASPYVWVGDTPEARNCSHIGNMLREHMKAYSVSSWFFASAHPSGMSRMTKLFQTTTMASSSTFRPHQIAPSFPSDSTWKTKASLPSAMLMCSPAPAFPGSSP